MADWIIRNLPFGTKTHLFPAKPVKGLYPWDPTLPIHRSICGLVRTPQTKRDDLNLIRAEIVDCLICRRKAKEKNIAIKPPRVCETCNRPFSEKVDPW